jgi:SAM-dependent methyltransferase
LTAVGVSGQSGSFAATTTTALVPLINPATDPLGQALLAYYTAPEEKLKILVESNLTEGESIPVWYLFRDYEAMPEAERHALNACKGHIIDAGAGAGSHSLWLQEQGAQVTALDASSLACEVAELRGVQRVQHTDLFSYNGPKADTLLLLMNGIGLCGTLNKLADFLQNQLAKILKPGGRLLTDSADIIYMFEQEDGSYTINLNDTYYGEMQYTMSFGSYRSEPFNWLYVSYALLEEAAEKAGLGIELLYQGDDNNYLAEITLPA